MSSSIKEPVIQPSELIVSLSRAVDLVSPRLASHHLQVAIIAYSIGRELDLPIAQINDTVLAAALHDVGAFSLAEKMATLQFELENPHQHAERGYRLLKSYRPFSHAADIVRFHHVPFSPASPGSWFNVERVPLGSHIVHLADRVAVLVGGQREVLGEARAIHERIQEQSGKMFMPDVVEAFGTLAEKESFWLDAASPPDLALPGASTIEADINELLDLARLFSRIIDFRSRFTVTHSTGVAASAEQLAEFIGFCERECGMIKVAGYLHDIGKMAVPTEILEKPSELTKAEFNVIRGHTYYTYRILAPIEELYEMNTWASFHHERLDGSGYPFHHLGRDLPLGSRIMAVADVFTAITEDRPYRKGMPEEKAVQVLQQMAGKHALDRNIVALLISNFAKINASRTEAQARAVEEYRELGEC